MDLDITTQLERLAEVLQRPDWWMFGITLANTIAIVALTWYLGIRQKKIQEIQQQIQREQLRIERMRPLREIYAYITEFRSITESFCRNVYMLMFHVINDQPEQMALKQLDSIKERITISYNQFRLLKADLIAQQGIQKNLNEVEALYHTMDHVIEILRNLLCGIYATYLYDKLDEVEKEGNLNYLIATVNKLDPNYPITPKTSLKDIAGKDVADMIEIIKRHLRPHTNVDMGYGIVDVMRIANIDNVIRPFNATFANAINQMLISFVNLQTDLFRGKNIVKCIEDEIFKA